MSEKQQKLILAIMQFLEQSMQDGTVKQDDSEGLQVAGTFQERRSVFRISLISILQYHALERPLASI